MAVLFTLLCGGALLVLGYFGYYFTRGHFIHGTEMVIDAEIRAVGMMPDPLAEDAPPGRIYVPFDGAGQPPADLPKPAAVLAEGIVVFDGAKDERRYAAKIHTFADGRRMLVGVDITRMARDYRMMAWLSGLSILFMLAVIAVSYMISVFVARGTGRIAGTARDIIETGDLSRRIAVGSRWDDLSHMAETLNLLLARIEGLMAGVRQVSDNIAHDLRTPLTRLRNRVEALQAAEPDNQVYGGLLEEADRLLATFGALLRISRIEAGKQEARIAPVRIDMIVADVVSLYEALAEEKGVHIDCRAAEVTRRGDRDLLFQAFANIMDNAVKFTPAGGRIAVDVEDAGGQAQIVIEDGGPGIPEADLPRVFERFYRGEASRTSPGSGLGLSLVAAAVASHGGSIRLENTGAGLRIITIL
jgi:signal transduction histidine kinase